MAPPLGIAAICSPDGRHLAMMPHPERCFRMLGTSQITYCDNSLRFVSIDNMHFFIRKVNLFNRVLLVWHRYIEVTHDNE